jgi:hypothetical protein
MKNYPIIDIMILRWKARISKQSSALFKDNKGGLG